VGNDLYRVRADTGGEKPVRMRSKQLLTLEEAVGLIVRLKRCGLKNVRKERENPSPRD